jgi:pimeloyl-ACP methyl ester carboxylesterase
LNNPRKYGNTPYSIALIHGGPGAPGEMTPVAKELSKYFGVLEPLQTKASIDGQIFELHSLLANNADLPVILIGHSWGAWLSFVFAARYDSLVKKIILVSSGPFEEKYTSDLGKIRMSRLNIDQRKEVLTIEELLNNKEQKDKDKLFARYGEIMSFSDAFEPLPSEKNVLEFQSEIFSSVWKEADELRRSGKLLQIGKKIQCPVLSIHGDYDPHPYIGVQEPLSRVITDFKFVLLEKCGHTPWLEKNAKDKFYNILIEEINVTFNMN